MRLYHHGMLIWPRPLARYHKMLIANTTSCFLPSILILLQTSEETILDVLAYEQPVNHQALQRNLEGRFVIAWG